MQFNYNSEVTYFLGHSVYLL